MFFGIKNKELFDIKPNEIIHFLLNTFNTFQNFNVYWKQITENWKLKTTMRVYLPQLFPENYNNAWVAPIVWRVNTTENFADKSEKIGNFQQKLQATDELANVSTISRNGFLGFYSLPLNHYP